MFLKRRRVNKRVLFNKYFVDVWSSVLIKKKLKNRSTQKFLQFFGRYISSIFTTRKLSKKFRERWRKKNSTRINIRKKLNYQLKLKTSTDIKPKPFSFSLKNKLKHPQYTAYILRVLTRLQIYKDRAGKVAVYRWSGSYKKGVFKEYFKKYARRRPFIKRFIRLRRKNDYIITELMDLVFQQYHYGFSTLTSFRMFLKKISNRSFSWKTLSLGLEGMLASQLCKTSFFLNIRSAYIAVKGGAIAVNGRVEKNPRKILNVGDTIKVLFPFVLVLSKFYILRLKNNLVIHSVAPYFEYNLRLLSFQIFRKPTKRERRLIVYYPFFKNELTWGAVKRMSYNI